MPQDRLRPQGQPSEGQTRVVGGIWGLCLICCDKRSISPLPLCHSCSDLCVFSGREGASLVAQMVKNLPAMQETQVQSLSLEDPLEERMAIHASILVWKIPWTEETGGLQSTVAKRWSNPTERRILSFSGREDQLFANSWQRPLCFWNSQRK